MRSLGCSKKAEDWDGDGILAQGAGPHARAMGIRRQRGARLGEALGSAKSSCDAGTAPCPVGAEGFRALAAREAEAATLRRARALRDRARAALHGARQQEGLVRPAAAPRGGGAAEEANE